MLPLSFQPSPLLHFLSLTLTHPSVQAFLLQTVDGKHQDLKYISPETVSRVEPFSRCIGDHLFLVFVFPWGWAACTDHQKREGKPWLPASPAGTNSDGLLQMVALLTGKFSNIVEKFVIVDCRYPYEYEGGHIKVRRVLVRPDPPFRLLAKKMNNNLPW